MPYQYIHKGFLWQLHIQCKIIEECHSMPHIPPLLNSVPVMLAVGMFVVMIIFLLLNDEQVSCIRTTIVTYHSDAIQSSQCAYIIISCKSKRFIIVKCISPVHFSEFFWKQQEVLESKLKSSHSMKWYPVGWCLYLKTPF